MNVKEFAEKYRVRLKKDECGDAVVPGKDHTGERGEFSVSLRRPRRKHSLYFQSHIFDGYANDQLGVYLAFESKKKWGNARRKMEAAGFVIRQDGDTEGIAMFDPANHRQARLALKLAGVKTRRMERPATPAQIAARQAFAEARRARTLQLFAV